MADNSSGTNGNSWTILAPEVKESGERVESVGPLAEGLEGSAHPEPLHPGKEKQDLTDLSQRSDFTDGPTEHNNGPESPQVAPLETNEVEAAAHASHVKDSTLNASPVENLTCLSSDPEQEGDSAGDPKREPLLNPDADSFSDSYTHISSGPSSTLHPAASQEEGLLAGEETFELRKTLREESSPEVEVSEEQEIEGDGLRKRKVAQLSPVDHQEEEEEEEGEEEPFRPPRREDDAGFSLNKCIFGAVILLGLGTIFFSEGEADVQELKIPEIKKEWLNLDASGNTPAGVHPPEVLDRLVKESEKIAVLQAQLQEQEGELKAAQLQVKEGTTERIKRAELEAEIQKMRGELDKLPALQKEFEQGNERAKKDLEALPTLQKELELLKAKVTELTLSTDGAQAVTLQLDSVTPSAGAESYLSSGQKSQEKERKEWKEGKKDREEGKPWKDRGSEGKDPKKQKEWEKKGHQEEGKDGRAKGEKKVGEDGKEWKKGKNQEDSKRWKDSELKRDSRDEGKKGQRKDDDKQWKDDKVKRERKEDNGKEDNAYKKEKPWQLDGGRWETKERKHSREKEEGDKKWDLRESKGGKQAGSNDKKEWKEKSEKRKDGKERNEKKKDWKEGLEWNTEERRNSKGEGKANKKGEKDNHREGNERKKDRKERNEWDAENEGKERNERKKDRKGRNEWDAENEGKERSERKKDRKGRNEWDVENERNPERKAHKKDSWKGEKDQNREGNGGKKEWKERADKRSSGKEKEWPKNEEKLDYRKHHKSNYEQNGEKWNEKDKPRNPSPDKEPHHLYSDRKQSQDHTHEGDYWAEQKERIRHFRGSIEGCDGVTACAHAEGLTPVGQQDFNALLLVYLNKLSQLAPENQASKKEELNKLIGEFFTNGVFIHDQMPFSEFVEDVADILEDMAEEEEDKQLEDEMEEFEREAMEKFVLPDRGGNEEKRRESGRKRVSG